MALLPAPFARRSRSAAASPSRLAEQVYPAAHLLVMLSVGSVEQRLTLAQRQVAAADQAVVEEAVDPLLERWPEIDEHVGADDEMEVVERSVGDEVVVRPGDARLQARVEAGGASHHRVVVGERTPSATLLVRLLETSHPLERISPEPSHREHVLVQVGRVDGAAAEESFLSQQHRQRVDLLAARASRNPDPARRIREKQRDHLVAKAADELRVAEHRRHADPDKAEESLHERRLVQDTVLVPRDGANALPRHRRRESTAERAQCVLAKVVAVIETDSLEKKPHLDLFELCARLLEAKRSRRFTSAHCTNHDLSMESKCALFTGFAM